MGTPATCISATMAAAQNSMSMDEVNELLTSLERIKKRKAAMGQLADLDAEVDKMAKDFTDRAKQIALLEKRQKVLNIFAERGRREVLAQFADLPAEGLKALNVGSQMGREIGRLSVSARQRALSAELMGGMIGKLKQAELEPFVKGQIDEAIAIEMFELRDGGTPGRSKIPEAQAIAKILNEAQEAARVMQNDAGALIRKLPGYIINQSHAYDMFKLRRADPDYLLRRMTETFGTEDTLKGADAREFFESVRDSLRSGIHMKLDGAGPEGGSPFKGAFNVAKAASQERVLHAASPEAFYSFFKEFGHGTLLEAVASGLHRAADNTGLMQVWGTNPRMAFDNLKRELAENYRNRPELADKVLSEAREWEFKEVNGETRMVGNATLAQVGSGIRALQTISKLGGAVVSAVTDIPLQALTLRYNGENMLSAWGKTLGTRMAGLSPAERTEFADLMGVAMDSFMGTYAARFDAGDSVPGHMTKATNLFFRLNLLNWWTDGWKVTTSAVLSRNLASKAGMPFAEIGEDLNRALGLYGIGEREWAALGKSAKNVGGRTYITPDGVDMLPDSVIAEMQGGGKLTDAQVRRARAELRQKLHGYILDQVDYAVLTPDAGTRAMLNLGTKRGTVVGEAMRLLMQFKSFPTAVIQKTWGREIYGRGANSVAEGVSQNLGGIAHLISMSIVFGYAAIAAKDILKGREPRDPTDPKTWIASFIQGGGGGIYADFIFGQYTRFGQSPLATLGGPTVGSIEQILKLWGRLREGDDVAAGAFQAIMSHMPFANLFYTRMALDYMILYDIQEALNPGSLVRMERRIEEQNNQQLYLKPSENRLTPVTGN